MPVPRFGFWGILQLPLHFAAKNGILQLRKEFVKRMKKSSADRVISGLHCSLHMTILLNDDAFLGIFFACLLRNLIVHD